MIRRSYLVILGIHIFAALVVGITICSLKKDHSSDNNEESFRARKGRFAKFKYQSTTTEAIILSTEKQTLETSSSNPCFIGHQSCTSVVYYSGSSDVESAHQCQTYCQMDSNCKFFTWFTAINYCAFSTECQLVQEDSGQVMGPKYCR